MAAVALRRTSEPPRTRGVSVRVSCTNHADRGQGLDDEKAAPLMTEMVQGVAG
jgi:hypothetical protein